MKKQPFRLEAHQDPRPDLLVERGPHGRGVGPWVPAVKHTLLAKYIGAASWPATAGTSPRHSSACSRGSAWCNP